MAAVDIATPTFTAAVLSIVLHVVNYNVTARLEFRTRIFTRLLGRNAVYVYAMYLVASAVIRDYLIKADLIADAVTLKTPYLSPELHYAAGTFLLAFGVLLNLWTLKALGVKGMYNGDSFGWLMSEPVTGGPFRFFRDPQYFGTSLSMLGSALIYGSQRGLVLTAIMYLVFQISSRLVEGPHMDRIYKDRLKSDLYGAAVTKIRSSKTANASTQPPLRASPRRRKAE